MKKIIFILIFLLISLILTAQVTVKIKNLVNIEGLSENSLIGYGIVSGLNGTGDSKRFSLTQKILGTILNNLGIDIENEKYYSQNIALVFLTAKLPPNIKSGEKINVSISSLGDAKSLNGGILLQAPLRGSDNQVYAIGQGPIAVIQDNTSRNKNNTVSGLIPNGAILQKDFASEFIKNNKLILTLDNPDFNTIIKIRDTILENYPNLTLNVLNNKIIEIDITEDLKQNIPELLSNIGNLEVEPELNAKIVINKSSGTIVISGDIKLSESAVSYKNLDINIKIKTFDNKEEQKSMLYLDSTTDIQSLINSLNRLGAKTEDIIAILSSLKSSGALFADIIVE